MKTSKIYFVLIFSLFALQINVLFSQNWSLINSVNKYHYSLNSSNAYNTTVFVDSLVANGNDTLFFLNKIVTDCDTCPNGFNEHYLFYNQPTFLQRKVLKHNSIYTFFDTLSFSILPNSNIGETWVFDTINNVSAEVVNSYIDNILGTNDSVKLIKLSTYDTLIISKQYGIVKFPVINNQTKYNLIGIENMYNQYGFSMPSFYDFFNFNIGDIFQYRNSSTWCQSGCNSDINDCKFTFLSKNIYTDSIVYIINKNGRYFHFESSMPTGDTSYYNYIDTIVYYDSLNSLCYAINNQIYFESYNNQLYITKANVYVDNNGVLTKQIGDINYGIPPFYEIFSDSLNLLKNAYNVPESYSRTLTVGLGQINKHWSWFEMSGGESLMGYVINGDTTGSVFPDNPLYNRLMYNENQSLVNVFPNPANEYIIVNFTRIDNHSLSQIIISDILGNEIKKIQTNSIINKINVRDISKGVYFLIIKDTNFIQSKKIVIN